MPIVLLSHTSRRKLRYTNEVLRTSRSSLVGYWTLEELSGPTALDHSGNGCIGTYASGSVVTYGQTGIGDRKTSVLFGSTGFCNIATTGLTAFSSNFNGKEITASLWCKASGLGVQGRAFIAIVNTNNRILVDRLANNTCQATYIAGGTVKTNVFAISSQLVFTHICVTASYSGNKFRVFVNGSPVGTTATSLEEWAGALTGVTIGASNNIPQLPYQGNIQHVAVWNTILSDTQIESLATV